MKMKIIFLLIFFLLIGQALALSTTNLRAYYKFDETSGTTIDDAHSTFDGTLTGGAVNETGILGKALKLGVGASDHVRLANWRPDKNFSINFWIKNNGDAGNRIWNEFDHQSTSGGWIVDGGDASGYGRFGQYQNGSFTYLADVNASQVWYLNNAWHMITVTYSATTRTIYFDGAYSTSGAISTIVSYVSTDTFNIGAFCTNGASCGQSFKGWIDESSLWNKVLSQSEITELYNSGTPLAYPFTPADECSRTLNTDWVVTSALDCNSKTINLGTGKLILSTGARLRLFDANLTCNRFDINASGSQLHLGSGSWIKTG